MVQVELNDMYMNIGAGNGSANNATGGDGWANAVAEPTQWLSQHSGWPNAVAGNQKRM